MDDAAANLDVRDYSVELHQFLGAVDPKEFPKEERTRGAAAAAAAAVAALTPVHEERKWDFDGHKGEYTSEFVRKSAAASEWKTQGLNATPYTQLSRSSSRGRDRQAGEREREREREREGEGEERTNRRGRLKTSTSSNRLSDDGEGDDEGFPGSGNEEDQGGGGKRSRAHHRRARKVAVEGRTPSALPPLRPPSHVDQQPSLSVSSSVVPLPSSAAFPPLPLPSPAPSRASGPSGPAPSSSSSSSSSVRPASSSSTTSHSSSSLSRDDNNNDDDDDNSTNNDLRGDGDGGNDRPQGVHVSGHVEGRGMPRVGVHGSDSLPPYTAIYVTTTTAAAASSGSSALVSSSTTTSSSAPPSLTSTTATALSSVPTASLAVTQQGVRGERGASNPAAGSAAAAAAAAAPSPVGVPSQGEAHLSALLLAAIQGMQRQLDSMATRLEHLEGTLETVVAATSEQQRHVRETASTRERGRGGQSRTREREMEVRAREQEEKSNNSESEGAAEPVHVDDPFLFMVAKKTRSGGGDVGRAGGARGEDEEGPYRSDEEARRRPERRGRKVIVVRRTRSRLKRGEHEQPSARDSVVVSEKLVTAGEDHRRLHRVKRVHPKRVPS